MLLHGMLDSSEGWDALARTTHRPTHAIDLPGFGHSDRAEHPRVWAMAEQVGEALRALELDDLVLVGHSLGGAVASAVAEQMPAHVSSLLLIAPAGYGRIPLAELFALPGMRDLAKLGMPLVARSRLVLGTAYSLAVANGVQASPELLAGLVERAASLGGGTHDAVLAINAAGRSSRAFHVRGLEYRGPVTALYGGDDQLVPISHAENLRRSVPDARVVVWDRSGHHPQAEAPTRLSRLVEWSAARARAERRRRVRSVIVEGRPLREVTQPVADGDAPRTMPVIPDAEDDRPRAPGDGPGRRSGGDSPGLQAA